MFKRIVLLLFFIPFGALEAQELIKGNVQDAETKEGLYGANVYFRGYKGKGTVSDFRGDFELRIPSEINSSDTLVIGYVGYEELRIPFQEIELGKSLNIGLVSEQRLLDEAIVRGRRPDENVKSLDVGRTNLDIKAIKTVPALFGEVDLLRSLQFLPGVQNAGEGTSGIFVRGGSADQNLVQVDGAPVYNPSHLFGFFSVFNPDAISSVDLYKGNMPADNGGRLSSLIDVKVKEGNYEKIKGEGGIGTISSRLTLDGPLLNDKSSFAISGRRTYADVFLRLSPDENINQNDLYFYDLSGKMAFRLGEKDKLTITAYNGRDYFGFSELFGFGWTNLATSALYQRDIREGSFLEFNLYHSEYTYDIGFEDETNGFLWESGIKETGFKGSISQDINSKISFKTGFHGQFYHFTPIALEPNNPEGGIQPFNTFEKNALQNNFYFMGKIDLHENFLVEAGLRYSLYNQIGPGRQFQYLNDEATAEENIIGFEDFERLDNIQFYDGWEPRATFRWVLEESLSLKGAYNRNYQYLQIATNSSAGLPIDRWIPADRYVAPIRADQISLGLFKNFANNTLEASVEAYHKSFDNIIDIVQGGNILFNDNIETEIRSGTGWARGIEFLLRKNEGNTTGWISYTYSRTRRQIEGINQGNPYAPRYDRPHDVAIVINHEFNKKYSLSGTWVFSSGQAVTFPVGNYVVDGQRIPLYDDGNWNASRLPDYHRMDLAFIIKNTPNKRRWESSWNFGVYNLYARQNPFVFQFTDIFNDDINFSGSRLEATSSRPGVIKTYLFGILPSITYNFTF